MNDTGTSSGGVKEVRKLARQGRLQPSAHVARYMQEYGYELTDVADWIINGRFEGTEPDDATRGGPPSVDGLKYVFCGQRSGRSPTVCKMMEDETGRKLFVITAEHPS